MENISKALLIAAAILLIILILSLIITFWDEMAAYFEAGHEAKMVEQLIEFNNQFENYNGKTIRGNELISIMNKIVDYNNYQSEMQGYERIIIEIDLKGHQNEIKYGNETGGKTLVNGNKISNVSNDDEIKFIAGASGRLSNDLGISDTKLQKLSADISDIVDEDSAPDKKAYKEYRTQKLMKIGFTESYINSNIDKIKRAAYQYYQFTQFKRAMFECKEVQYNDKGSTRVNKMKFQVVLNEKGNIKFD